MYRQSVQECMSPNSNAFSVAAWRTIQINVCVTGRPEAKADHKVCCLPDKSLVNLVMKGLQQTARCQHTAADLLKGGVRACYTEALQGAHVPSIYAHGRCQCQAIVQRPAKLQGTHSMECKHNTSHCLQLLDTRSKCVSRNPKVLFRTGISQALASSHTWPWGLNLGMCMRMQDIPTMPGSHVSQIAGWHELASAFMTVKYDEMYVKGYLSSAEGCCVHNPCQTRCLCLFYLL